MIPDFKPVLRYDDLSGKPKNFDIQKILKRQAPLYYLKTQLIRDQNYSDAAIMNCYSYLKDEIKHKKMEKILSEEPVVDKKKQQEEEMKEQEE